MGRCDPFVPLSAVVAQDYLLEAPSRSVIRGNAALFRCEVPSFVGDLVHVTAWQEETTGHHYYPNDDHGSKPACTGHHYYPNDDW
ncbi:hypothetical protein HAZT_HAZT008150 [Hyalella azteca]|uniref:Ig-like domain-containing protein n=1 Tax=Hyalella azteca TaxID=294128 RepID=A0A6A0GXT7_HYAAZ|nr:hypothetical protein HAZT_HAZT008150 [Hyalella azteca]